MQFNGKELTAIAKMAASMAAADGNFDKVEFEEVIKELIRFGVDSTQAAAILAGADNMEASDAFATISAMTTTQKKYVSGFWAAIMLSDGKIEDSEVKMWQLICTLTRCPTMSAGEALEFWQNN